MHNLNGMLLGRGWIPFFPGELEVPVGLGYAHESPYEHSFVGLTLFDCVLQKSGFNLFFVCLCTENGNFAYPGFIKSLVHVLEEPTSVKQCKKWGFLGLAGSKTWILEEFEEGMEEDNLGIQLFSVVGKSFHDTTAANIELW